MSALVVPVAALAVVATVGSPAGAGPAHTGTATPPFWCQWIPSEYAPPECQTPVSADSAADTAGPIESTFATTGSWAVSTQTVGAGPRVAYTVFYPTDLGANGVRHPLLTWGNGTGSSPDDYAETLSHLASWGFVVVASTSEQTGWGDELLAGVKYLVAQNRQPSSSFYGRLDTTKIGALGHSQGATGALNATIMANGLIKSTLAISLPDPFWFLFNRGQMPDFRRLRMPVFFVTGGRDFLSTSSAQQDYYNRTQGPAGKAALASGGHNSVQEAGNDLLGYVTAWMLYTLQGDDAARAAFVGNGAEINSNPSWQNQTQKNLP